MEGDVTYTDGYTLDGRVKPGPGVTKAKVMAVKKMVEATMRGDRIERGRLEESLTTSDAIFSYAYLTTINILPVLTDEEEEARAGLRDWLAQQCAAYHGHSRKVLASVDRLCPPPAAKPAPTDDELAKTPFHPDVSYVYEALRARGAK